MTRATKMRVVEEGEQFYADDGTRLLFYEDIAERSAARGNPLKVDTLHQYHRTAEAARLNGEEGNFPAPEMRVRKMVTRRDSRKVATIAPVWREDKIDHWIGNRLGPGGRPRSELGQGTA
jgi:hypothetical protein